MSLKQSIPSTFNSLEEPKRNINITNVINRYLYHWPLFVIGIGLSVVLAFYYLKIAKPVYEVKATLLIKDEKKAPDAQSALHEIELLGSSKTVENEIEVLKSNQLIKAVVQDLELTIAYQQKDKYFYQDLYKSTPVKLTLIKANNLDGKKEFNIVIKNNKTFFIENSDKQLKELSFNKAYTDYRGVWKLEPTSLLSSNVNAKIKITLHSAEILALDYQKLINTSLINKLGTTVLLSINDKIPQRGKDILNRVIYNYNYTATSEKNRETKTTLDFLNQKLDSLTGELSSAEKGIEGFKSSRGLTDISMQSQVSLQNLQANDTKLNEANIQLNTINTIDRYVNTAQNFEKVPSANGISDANLSNLIDKLSQLQLQYEQLAATTPETSPDFEPINRQIKATKIAIKESVKNIKSTLQGTSDKLQSYNSNFETSIKNIPTQERQYINIKRQQSSKESLYTYYLQKREEVAANYASTLKNDHVVDQAFSGPIKSPVKNLVYAVALLLGSVLPICLIYTRNVLKNRVIDIDEIKNSISAPVLAELSLETSTYVVNKNETAPNIISEQFRTLRTKLYYLFGEKMKGRVTLITSSISGEGKSYVSSKLAIALASVERKIIVLEMDLRKPQISEKFNLSKDHAGITNFLANTASLTEIIQVSEISENLHIIGSGPLVNDSSELLEKKELKDLILQLRNRYDDIIIDSPPVHLVSDAMILAQLSDVTLYIIRQGYTNKIELDFLKELYQKNHLPTINIVFNGIKRIKFGYGYNYDTSYYNQKSKPGFLRNTFSDIHTRF